MSLITPVNRSSFSYQPRARKPADRAKRITIISLEQAEQDTDWVVSLLRFDPAAVVAGLHSFNPKNHLGQA